MLFMQSHRVPMYNFLDFVVLSQVKKYGEWLDTQKPDGFVKHAFHTACTEIQSVVDSFPLHLCKVISWKK